MNKTADSVRLSRSPAREAGETIVVPVIMAGGTGSRLWPLSRQARPKQFLQLGGEATMLEETIGRLKGVDCTLPLVVCNEDHRFLAAEQLRQAGQEEARMLLEPVARSTAPALAIASMLAMRDHGDPIVVALAADHMIADTEAFQRALAVAVKAAKQDKLVAFGIVPKWAETGYGYIETGEAFGDGGAMTIARFVEKPDEATAKGYLEDGRHLWNSGMFVFRAGRFLDELKLQRPDVHEACSLATRSPVEDMHFTRIDAEAFARSPDVSVDYAVMEKTKDAVVMPLDAGWSDVGSWSALWDMLTKDEDGNVLDGDVMALDTKNTLVRSDYRLVATVGVSDLVVVETKDAVLVAAKESVEKVKAIVARLKEEGRSEAIVHRVVYRPWGHYDSIDLGERDQVKRITVNPGAKLSVQMHHHRSEHWVVVRGTAKVHKGENVILLTENESTYIPLGEIHALENPGKIPLELIEVQSGSYLGEDDIVRLEDKYGRG